MMNIRHWYIYLVSIISLQAVVWAVIGLVRELLGPAPLGIGSDLPMLIAVLIIGLPIYLGHWLWAQRLARRDASERATVLRRVYLYAVLALCLAPFLASAFDLVEILLGRVLGETSRLIMPWQGKTPDELLVASIAPMVVLPLVGFYHGRVLRNDARVAPEPGDLATVRRVFVLAFSAVGLVMTSVAVISLLGWLIRQIDDTIFQSSIYVLSTQLARLVVGLPVWLLFWTWAQRLASSGDEEEQRSALRRTYLYSTVFVAVLAFVTTVALLLRDFLRHLLDVGGASEGTDVAVPVIIVSSAVWVYHGLVLRQNARESEESDRQQAIRRVYFYLVAGIGLVAWLIGLAGAVGVVLRVALGSGLVIGLKEDVATFLSLIIAGLPVWLLAWRRIQLTAADAGALGVAEVRSIVRKIYLYLCLFGATMTVLGSAVFVVARLAGSLIGVDSEISTTQLADALAFSLIAAGVWLYHGAVLRSDGKRLRHEEAARLASVHMTVLDTSDGSLGRAMRDRLGRALPGLDIRTIGLTPAAAAALGSDFSQPELAASLAESKAIIMPWTAIVAGLSDGAGDPALAAAVIASPAHKILLPAHQEGWTWIGAAREREDEMIKQAVQAAEQIVHGETVTAKRSLGVAGAVVLIAVGLCLLWTVISILINIAGFLY